MLFWKPVGGAWPWMVNRRDIYHQCSRPRQQGPKRQRRHWSRRLVAQCAIASLRLGSRNRLLGALPCIYHLSEDQANMILERKVCMLPPGRYSEMIQTRVCTLRVDGAPIRIPGIPLSPHVLIQANIHDVIVFIELMMLMFCSRALALMKSICCWMSG